MKEFLARTKSAASGFVDEEQAITIITELIKATQIGALAWSIAKPSELLPLLDYFEDAGDIYTAQSGDMILFLISGNKRKEDSPTVNKWWLSYWTKFPHAVMLGIYDPAKKTSWVIPGSGALIDLLGTVENQLSSESENAWSHLTTGLSPNTSRMRRGVLRQQVLQAYDYQCAISRENTRDVLEIAQILPNAQGGSNAITNYIVLRADLHRLFDHGLISITPSYRVIVSPKLTSPGYVIYEDTPLHLPEDPALRPTVDAVIRHNRYLFLES